MRKIAALAFAVFLVVAWFRPSPANATCVEADAILQLLRSRPEVAKVDQLQGEALSRGIEIFSAMPPESDPALIGAMAIIEYKNGAGLVLAGPKGKFCGAIQFPSQEHLKAFRRASLGAPI